MLNNTIYLFRMSFQFHFFAPDKMSIHQKEFYAEIE